MEMEVNYSAKVHFAQQPPVRIGHKSHQEGHGKNSAKHQGVPKAKSQGSLYSNSTSSCCLLCIN